jgi:ATP phosphoribosyltransferase
MDDLKIALAKGRIGKEASKLFKGIGLCTALDPDSRKLIFKDEKNKISFTYVKSSDVITYVQNGVADLGVVGKDEILEQETDLYELYDLGFGKCKFAIAGIENQRLYVKDRVIKVATKYPKVTKKYFAARNQRIKIIKLNGSVELAPLVGLADVIVDLVETGSTLKANGLKVIEEMFPISARLICNRVSYRFKYQQISQLLTTLKEMKAG